MRWDAELFRPGPVMIATATPDAAAINFFWLLRLRWWAVAGQVVVIIAAALLVEVRLPLLSLFSLVAISVLINLAGMFWAGRGPKVAEWMVASLTAFDVLLLTGLLYLSGGPYNPFSFLYVVHIALASVILEVRWAWAVAVLSLAAFAGLFAGHVDLVFAHTGAHDFERIHLRGMWVALAVAAVFIVHFLQRVTRSLADRDAELATAREQNAKSEKLASLATLSAGAAHELSTPLSTIAVIAKELERELAAGVAKEDAVADAKLIREQVQRCRRILDQMAADAGASKGESIVKVTAEALLEAALEGLPGRERVDVVVDARARAEALEVPVRALAQTLRAVTKNALDASPAEARVELRIRSTGDRWSVSVADRGSGMPPEILARVGEPFFTTKEPGRGMGLGLFLGRAVVERLGGGLELTSRAGEGTEVVLSVPGVLERGRTPRPQLEGAAQVETHS